MAVTQLAAKRARPGAGESWATTAAFVADDGHRRTMQAPRCMVAYGKQEWVWAFADAYMLASSNPVEHIRALELGYRIWDVQGGQDPCEAANDRLSGQDKVEPRTHRAPRAAAASGSATLDGAPPEGAARG